MQPLMVLQIASTKLPDAGVAGPLEPLGGGGRGSSRRAPWSPFQSNDQPSRPLHPPFHRGPGFRLASGGHMCMTVHACVRLCLPHWCWAYLSPHCLPVCCPASLVPDVHSPSERRRTLRGLRARQDKDQLPSQWRWPGFFLHVFSSGGGRV